jgi:hypothetical protein
LESKEFITSEKFVQTDTGGYKQKDIIYNLYGKKNFQGNLSKKNNY